MTVDCLPVLLVGGVSFLREAKQRSTVVSLSMCLCVSVCVCDQQKVITDLPTLTHCVWTHAIYFLLKFANVMPPNLL